MDRSAFAREVAAFSVGKRLPDGVYAHVSLIPYLPAPLRDAIAEAPALAELAPGAFDVVKLATNGPRVSLLAYPGFFDEAFPALTASFQVDLEARSISFRSYAGGDNPPILHRKETITVLVRV